MYEENKIQRSQVTYPTPRGQSELKLNQLNTGLSNSQAGAFPPHQVASHPMSISSWVPCKVWGMGAKDIRPSLSQNPQEHYFIQRC